MNEYAALKNFYSHHMIHQHEEEKSIEQSPEIERPQLKFKSYSKEIAKIRTDLTKSMSKCEDPDEKLSLINGTIFSLQNMV